VVSGVTRAGREGSRVIETPEGIMVYAARHDGDRWRAVWYENGERRQCQSATEDRMAASLEKVAVRLTADAPHMLRTGDDLIGFYLSPDRLPAERQWSRKRAETQRYLCERFMRPVIGRLVCQDIRVAEMQAAVNAAPTAQEGRRVRAMISALTGAGISGGYLASPRLKEAPHAPGSWLAGVGIARVRCRTVAACGVMGLCGWCAHLCWQVYGHAQAGPWFAPGCAC